MNIKNLWIFDKNKLLILKALYKCKDSVCGCDFREKLKIKKNLLSYHIKILKENGFVKEVKCGRKKEYSLVKEKEAKVKEILKCVEII